MELSDVSFQDLINGLHQRIDEELEDKDIRPVGDRIVVVPLERDDIQKRGEIFVVEDKQNKEIPYLVRAVSNRIKQNISPGDVVYASKHSGHDVELYGVEFCLMKEHDVLAVFNDPEGVPQ